MNNYITPFNNGISQQSNNIANENSLFYSLQPSIEVKDNTSSNYSYFILKLVGIGMLGIIIIRLGLGFVLREIHNEPLFSPHNVNFRYFKAIDTSTTNMTFKDNFSPIVNTISYSDDKIIKNHPQLKIEVNIENHQNLNLTTKSDFSRENPDNENFNSEKAEKHQIEKSISQLIAENFEHININSNEREDFNYHSDLALTA